MLPLEGYSGKYTGVTCPWMSLDYTSTVCQSVSGMYT